MFIVILFFVSTTVSAWTPDSYGVHYNSNVGVGCSSSSVAKLTVHPSNSAVGDIRLGTSTAELTISSGGDGIAKIRSVTTGGRLAIEASDQRELLTITSGGNVGIGTTTPGALLEISGNNAFPEITITERMVGMSAAILFETPARNWLLFADSSPDLFGVLDSDAGEYRIIIDYLGRVGIGTTDPLTRLHVNGTVTANDIRINVNGHQESVRAVLEYILARLE